MQRSRRKPTGQGCIHRAPSPSLTPSLVSKGTSLPTPCTWIYWAALWTDTSSCFTSLINSAGTSDLASTTNIFSWMGWLCSLTIHVFESDFTSKISWVLYCQKQVCPRRMKIVIIPGGKLSTQLCVEKLLSTKAYIGHPLADCPLKKKSPLLPTWKTFSRRVCVFADSICTENSNEKEEDYVFIL